MPWTKDNPPPAGKSKKENVLAGLVLQKYSEAEARDNSGKWTSGGGSETSSGAGGDKGSSGPVGENKGPKNPTGEKRWLVDMGGNIDASQFGSAGIMDRYTVFGPNRDMLETGNDRAALQTAHGIPNERVATMGVGQNIFARINAENKKKGTGMTRIPLMVDALLKAGARHGKVDKANVQKAHDCVSTLVEGAYCGLAKEEEMAAKLAKVGARHAAADLTRIKKAHVLLSELGAICTNADEPLGGKT
jgi:hypothetical protein